MTILKVIGASNHTEETREINDYYATDPQALIDFLDAFNADNHKLSDHIWEPSCGEGNLSKVLEDRDHKVRSTDLIDRGYGQVLDFLTVQDQKFDGDILTNPPYKYSEQFVKKALSIVNTGKYVAMLFKIQFIESQRRHKLFTDHPPKFIYVHSRRIQIWKNNEKTSNNALCYAWFVWQKGSKDQTVMRWIK